MTFKLTEIETTVIKHVMTGMTNLQVAEEIGYSQDGVKKVLNRLYKKLVVNGRVELVRKFLTGA